MINYETCQLVIGAMTVLMEAEGESYEGKLAVAYTIRNRVVGEDLIGVVLKPWQFSCWNTDSPTRRRVGQIVKEGGKAWQEAVKATEAAFFATEVDPSHGATHYLNVNQVLKAVGKLPSWYDGNKITAVIGRHTFLKGV